MRHRLWIVDDVPLELEAAEQALAEKYDLALFVDGAGLLESALRDELPDLLVLDWHIGNISGLDVVRFLREHPRTSRLPILVFTATGSAEDLVEALSAGADDYVTKGSSREELGARVAALIRASGLRERAERAERELAVLLEREREARAEAEAANRAKDLFLATVSHELRSPLNAILGWAWILKMRPEAPKLEQAARVIERSARAQAQMIDDLLDLSRIVSGKLRLEVAPTDLAAVVEHAVEAARPLATAKGLALHLDARPGWVGGDAARLQQITSNLLTNAVKFTPKGGTIRVEVGPRGGEIVLRIEDSGPGIDLAVLPHVFDRFRQADSSTTRSHGGLGLGLTIVRQLAELHRGRVVATNLEGGGARFEVALPSLPHVAGPRPGPPEPPPVEALRGRTILVVEDEGESREVVRAILAGCGARVLEARSGLEARELLEHHSPDLVVSDLAMPIEDGLSLLRHLRGRASRVPAVALTARLREEDRAESAAAGFDAHLGKPIDPDRLIRTLADLCRGGRP